MKTLGQCAKQLSKYSRLIKYSQEGDCDKIFNHGMGCLPLVIVYGKDLLVNSCLATSKDWAMIRRSYKGTGLRLYSVAYGYPTFYNHTMTELHRKGYSYRLEKL